MSFKDLTEGIDEIFSDAQAPYERDARRDAVFPSLENIRGREQGRSSSSRASTGGFNRGFRIFVPNPPKSPERLAAMRVFERKYAEDDIRARLLAGERPKLGGRGRPPTRWFKVAAELGIDLQATA